MSFLVMKARHDSMYMLLLVESRAKSVLVGMLF